MQINEAADMLANPNISGKIWADLGCGAGTFTKALAQLLPPGSLIHAIDLDQRALQSIPELYGQTRIVKHRSNFENESFPFTKSDGILMANSMHYIKEKRKLIAKIRTHLAVDACLLVVEYDTERPVKQWVPYPISFASLATLFTDSGFGKITKLNERDSVFGSTMYSALIMF